MRFLVVGSSVVDMFSELDSPQSASISNQTITFHLGDKVPVDINHQALGGNGMNVSVGLTRLGLPVTFYTYVGSDSLSANIEQTLQNEGVETIFERDSLTSSLSFILNVNDDRIIFSHHPIRNHDFSPPKDSNFDFIFLSSVGAHWENTYKKVLAYATQAGIPILFSPGSKQLDTPIDMFFLALHQSEMLLVNTEEARVITSYFGETHSNIESLCNSLVKLGPKTLSLTDGANGAYAYHKNQLFHIPPFPNLTKPEKTGAGDAYASGFLAGYMHTKDITEAMRWGSANAYMAMQEVGAQNGLATQEKLLNTLQKHDTFKASLVEHS